MTWKRQPFISLPQHQASEVPSQNKTQKTSTHNNIFAETARAAWHSKEVATPRCDFSPSRQTMTSLTGGFRAITLWRRSLYGMTLEQIKASPDMPGFCAKGLTALLLSIIGQSPSPEEFVIVAPPKRRHPGKENFASRLCEIISRDTGLPFIDDFAVCTSRQRINATFHLAAPVPLQNNIIVIDDIITTGSTLIAMHRLIQSIGKNDLHFAAILNRK